MSAIDVYCWKTPNGKKVQIAVEELGLSYNLHPVDISKGEQHKPEFLAINPNNKIPAIVDGPQKVFESGAILLYLAEKTGKLLGTTPEDKWNAIQWTFWQVGGLGPMFGQNWFFKNSDNTQAKERYITESRRLFKVLDGQLAKNTYLAGEQYTIADISTYAWALAGYENFDIKKEDYPNVKRWLDLVGSRPAVQKGMNLIA